MSVKNVSHHLETYVATDPLQCDIMFLANYVMNKIEKNFHPFHYRNLLNDHWTSCL